MYIIDAKISFLFKEKRYPRKNSGQTKYKRKNEIGGNRWICLSRTRLRRFKWYELGPKGNGEDSKKYPWKIPRNRASNRLLVDRILRSRARMRCTLAYLREFRLDVWVDVPVKSFERNSSNFKACGKVSTDRIGMSRLQRIIRSAPNPRIKSELETWFPVKL